MDILEDRAIRFQLEDIFDNIALPLDVYVKNMGEETIGIKLFTAKRFDDYQDRLYDLFKVYGLDADIIAAGKNSFNVNLHNQQFPRNAGVFTRKYRADNNGEFPYFIVIRLKDQKGSEDYLGIGPWDD